jgi:hypothetical protein
MDEKLMKFFIVDGAFWNPKTFEGREEYVV